MIPVAPPLLASRAFSCFQYRQHFASVAFQDVPGRTIDKKTAWQTNGPAEHLVGGIT